VASATDKGAGITRGCVAMRTKPISAFQAKATAWLANACSSQTVAAACWGLLALTL
jgi:hypothetical protein